MLSPETIEQIEALAGELAAQFTPPELIPGCEVLSVADKDQYATNNGWVEARVGRHNQQRCRWRGQVSNVQVGDYVDVLFFVSYRLFVVLGQGGAGAVSNLDSHLSDPSDAHDASAISTDTTNFDGNLSAADDTVQKALETLDELAPGSNVWPLPGKANIGATEYDTITAAAAAAIAGQTIFVGIGQFTENVTIPSGVSLMGSGNGTVIQGIVTFAGGGQSVAELIITYSANSASVVRALIANGSLSLYECMVLVTNSGAGGSQAVRINGSSRLLAFSCEITSFDDVAISYNSSDTTSVIFGGVITGQNTAVEEVSSGTITVAGAKFGQSTTVSGSVIGHYVNSSGDIVFLGSSVVSGLDKAKVSKIWESDEGAAAWATDAAGELTGNGTRDIFPQGSAKGLNARFEYLFGDDKPTGLTDWQANTFLDDNLASNIIGFSTGNTTADSDSYTPSSPFAKSNSGTVYFYVKNHHLRVNSQSAGTSQLQWTSSTGKNDYFAWIQFLTRAVTTYGGELRIWGVQSPGAGDAYAAARFFYDATTYPDWPWRIGIYTGTGTTFALADGTQRAQSPWPVHDLVKLGLRVRASNGQYDIFVSGVHAPLTTSIQVATYVPAGPPFTVFKTAYLHVATSFQEIALDSVEIT